MHQVEPELPDDVDISGKSVKGWVDEQRRT